MVTMKQVEEAMMVALGSLIAVGFFVVSITFFLGSLVLCGALLNWAWGLL
jgi:hypothetical protein